MNQQRKRKNVEEYIKQKKFKGNMARSLAGKGDELIKELQNLDIDILAITEGRRKEKENLRLLEIMF